MKLQKIISESVKDLKLTGKIKTKRLSEAFDDFSDEYFHQPKKEHVDLATKLYDRLTDLGYNVYGREFGEGYEISKKYEKNLAKAKAVCDDMHIPYHTETHRNRYYLVIDLEGIDYEKVVENLNEKDTDFASKVYDKLTKLGYDVYASRNTNRYKIVASKTNSLDKAIKYCDANNIKYQIYEIGEYPELIITFSARQLNEEKNDSKEENIYKVTSDDGDKIQVKADSKKEVIKQMKDFFEGPVKIQNHKNETIWKVDESIEGDQIAQANIDSKNNNFEKDKETERQVKVELAKNGIVDESAMTSKNIAGDELSFEIDDNGNFKFYKNGEVTGEGHADNPAEMEAGLIKMGFKKIEKEIGLTEDVGSTQDSQHGQIAGLMTIVNSLINDENEAIDGYNSAIVNFEIEGQSGLTDIFRSIIAEEQTHIGELQTVLNNLNPDTVSNIEDGQQEAEQELSGESTNLDESLKSNITLAQAEALCDKYHEALEVLRNN